MSNLDSQRWYQITMKEYKTSNLLSLCSDSANGTGQAFFQITNTSSPNQQWQLFPSTNNTYVLRSGESTAYGYLTANVRKNDTSTVNDGNTVPRVTNYMDIRDESMYWSILPWGDGSFWMENAQNGSAWHLEKEPSAFLEMSSNITKPQAGQSFLFKPLGAISQKAYGTLKTPPSQTTPSSATTSIPGFTGTSTVSSSASSSPSGLSTGVEAAIGASVGGVVLIALLLSIFFLLRRRKRRNILKQQTPIAETDYADYKPVTYNAHDSNVVAEMWQPENRQGPVELANEQGLQHQKIAPVELEPGYPLKVNSPVELDSRQLR